jgi:hypothetical protein
MESSYFDKTRKLICSLASSIRFFIEKTLKMDFSELLDHEINFFHSQLADFHQSLENPGSVPRRQLLLEILSDFRDKYDFYSKFVRFAKLTILYKLPSTDEITVIVY